MQYPISDAAAVAFARGCYTVIAYGRSVDDATFIDRVAILGAAAGMNWSAPRHPETSRPT